MKPDNDDPRRRLLLDLLAGGWLCGPLVLPKGAMAAGLPRPLAADQSIFRVAEASVNGRPADLGTRVKAGDTVRTGSGGEMIFVVGSTAVLVRSDSEVRIGGDSTVATVLRALTVATGRVLAVFAGGTHTVRTATASVALRGTGYYVEADAEQTYFCTCYGEAQVTANDDATSKELVKATHHDKPLYVLRSAEPGRGIRSAPFKNHTDEELSLIEALVGRRPPFIHPSQRYDDRRDRVDYGR